MFIIYNTFSIAVTQRRSEIGILRSLGATRGQIRALFLGESAVAGLAGSALGVLFGILIARALAIYISGLLGGDLRRGAKADEVSTDPKLLGLALAMGTLASIIAAIIPARNAAAVDPVKALHKGSSQTFSSRESRQRRVAAGVAAVAALIILPAGKGLGFLWSSDALAVVAALLLTPTLAMLVTRALRPLLKLVRPVEGTLAADSLIQAPRRTSGTVAALMLSLALVVSLGGMAHASYTAISAG